MADFSADYFRTKGLADKMAYAYGSIKQEIVLVAGLREPMTRMLSHFAFNVHRRVRGFMYANESAGSFQEHVDAYFRAAHSQKDDWWVEDERFATVQNSLYFQCLRMFLDAGFGAKQFIIFPGRMYMDHRDNLDTNPVLQAMRARFGSSALRPKKSDAQLVSNRGTHDTLKTLLDEVTLHKLERDVFGPQNRLLAELLASQMSNGMVLVGYEGKAFDTEAVLAWLQKHWDY